MSDKDSKNTECETNTRERIARHMVYGSLMFLIVLAVVVIAVTAVKDSGQLKETTQNVFNALLPLLGTWVGTVLAYYFSKDNFQMASNAVRDTVREFNPQLEKLRRLAVRDVMLPFGAIKNLQKLEAGKDEKQIKIQAMEDSLGGVVTRIPVFDDKNAIRYVIHQSMLYKFIAKKSIKDGKFNAEEANLQDFLDFEDMKETVSETIAFVAKDANLADAKSRMDSVSKCQDVFVTEHGNGDEPVLGWITNIDIARNANL